MSKVTLKDVQDLFKRIPSFEKFLDKKCVKELYIHNAIFHCDLYDVRNIKSYKDDGGGQSIISNSFCYAHTPE